MKRASRSTLARPALMSAELGQDCTFAERARLHRGSLSDTGTPRVHMLRLVCICEAMARTHGGGAHETKQDEDVGRGRSSAGAAHHCNDPVRLADSMRKPEAGALFLEART